MKKGLLLLAIPILITLGWYISGQKNSTTSYPIQNSPSPTKKTCKALSLITPKVNQQVASPLVVTVVIDNSDTNCHWTVFEAQAGTIDIIDEDKSVIGQGVLTTEDDWMTDQPVTYKGSITFTKSPVGKILKLQIHEENPSGNSDTQILTFPLTY